MSAERRAEILIVGGGTGGCAAALAAASLGRQVMLTEPTDWLGGQLTSQGVPPDEHPWIEQFGCTGRYRRFREEVRRHYRTHGQLTPAAFADPWLNPGGGLVSRLCCDPRVALAVIEQMLGVFRWSGHLTVLRRHTPVAAETDGDRVLAVTLRDLESGRLTTVSAALVLDATETGELLELAGVEHVTGSEAQAVTGEPHAGEEARPENEQAVTWCAALGWDPTGEHVIDPPPSYGFWRDYAPELTPPWPGRLLDWPYTHPASGQPKECCLFGEVPGAVDLFRYRQVVRAAHHEAGIQEATIVNWPQNDYLLRRAIGEGAEQALAEARELTLSLVYWLQTEAPRPDGGQGYPGLKLRGDLLGTADGLAKAPYHREGRRIVAEFRVTEQHVGTAAREGRPAELFPDSVGLGAYRIDLHPTCGGDNYLDLSSQPFQIPLGALLPVRVENLLPAAKNIGATHITNGCYRLHPVEWNIGEAAGALAAFALERRVPPRAVRHDSALLADFQRLLERQGVELAWPVLRPL